VVLARPDVISVYPITPQTSIVEKLSEYSASGHLPSELVLVESEHSAMACLVGASTAGSRTFTATSSHGLAYMHEMLHWAAGARLPIVLVNVNRAMGPGWNIWVDQTDTVSQRDVGWLQLYVASNQEAFDTVLQAFKIAETLELPVMVITEAFVLSHTAEPIEVPDPAEVEAFLPQRETPVKLDTGAPRFFGALVTPDYYMEHRYMIHRDHLRALEVVSEVGREYGERFGRSYDLVHEYRAEDAEVLVFTMGTMASTGEIAVDALRGEGKRAGLVRLRAFRPFPIERVRSVLGRTKKVAVIDRNISYSHRGALAMETLSALYGTKAAPVVFPFIAGLGGRDVSPEDIMKAAVYAFEHDGPEEENLWLGLKK
ncbi:MAG TPA: pyruvate ferredoxin oxidoreductase, partial [Planctomycetes bacterium]|nr:pyruvate ferredoxin oxidoreductase [Planctomycetota bacterium]